MVDFYDNESGSKSESEAADASDSLKTLFDNPQHPAKLTKKQVGRIYVNARKKIRGNFPMSITVDSSNKFFELSVQELWEELQENLVRTPGRKYTARQLAELITVLYNKVA